MKKLLSLALGLLLLCSCALAETAPDLNALSTEELYRMFAPDLSTMPLDELLHLYQDVLTEIGRRGNTAAPDRSTDGVIAFRNLPWGISAPAAVEALAGSGISGRPKANDCSSWEFKTSSDSLTASCSLEDSGWYIYSTGALTVAGYPVSSTYLYFLNTFDDEQVYTTEDHSAFYKAKYTFAAADSKAAYLQLASKLSTLYGKGTEGTVSTGWWSSGGNYTGYSDWTVWYGADNTAVVLEYHYEVMDADGSLKSERLTLTYGRSDSVAMINALEAAIAREQAEEAAGSFDGL